MPSATSPAAKASEGAEARAFPDGVVPAARYATNAGVMAMLQGEKNEAAPPTKAKPRISAGGKVRPCWSSAPACRYRT
ncbi:MAG: hypothetical protein BGP23_16215 [Lysobacterales bacterium 66-474]|nr:MAG: hypothetical protein BGP23_16215 [Xanthomonadales bacterium 66-474]